jgi:outer membrane protein TolC
MRRILALGAALAALYHADAAALDMDEAVRTALANNHRLKQYERLHDSARENVGTARGGFLPSLDLSFTRTERREAVIFGGEESDRFIAQVTYNLFNGLADLKALRGAGAGAEAARYQRRAVQADMILAVREAYIRLLRADRVAENERESVELLERQRRDAELYYREGLIAKNDLLKVEVELATARQLLLIAEGSGRTARSLLARVMGTDIPEGETFEDFTELPEIDDLTYDALAEEMYGSRSELRYLEEQAEASRLEADAIRGAYLPAVDLSLIYEDFQDSGSFAGADLSVEDKRAVLTARWNIFDGFRTTHRRNGARYRAAATEEELADTKQELAYQLRAALEDYRVAAGRVDVAQTAVVQAEENYRVTDNLFKERAATTTDLLDARTFLTRARNEYVFALYAAHLAASRIERVLERTVPES